MLRISGEKTLQARFARVQFSAAAARWLLRSARLAAQASCA